MAINNLGQNLNIYQDLEAKFIENLSWRRLTTFAPNKNIPIHNWFQYLQGFSAPLVEALIDLNNINSPSIVLDPFCGVGTTLLTCKENGVNSIGLDISPLAVFVSKVKLNDAYNEDEILNHTEKIVNKQAWYHDPPDHPIFKKGITQDRINILLSLKDLILEIEDESIKDFLLLALMSVIEESSLIRKDGAHYRYVSVPRSEDTLKSFRMKVHSMISDSRQLRLEQRKGASCRVDIGDARSIELEDNSVDFVITSPPYLNRDNYIAQHKMELFILGFVLDMGDYRKLTRSTLRSHVEADYVAETEFRMHEVDTLVNEIRKRPLNNPKIPDMIEGYFEDMNIVFKELSRCVRKDGIISVIVGNSAWSGVLVETDKILSKIAGLHGFEVNNIVITRYKLNSAQQINRYGKIPIRESIIMASKRSDT